MLYSILVAFLTYYGILLFTGLLVKSKAICGLAIFIAVACFWLASATGGRRSERNCGTPGHNLLIWLGSIFCILGLMPLIVLPVIGGSGLVWVRWTSVLAGTIIFLSTRRHWYYRWYQRYIPYVTINGARIRPQPPLGQEWLRWLLVFIH